MERGQLRGSVRGVERWRKTQGGEGGRRETRGREERGRELFRERCPPPRLPSLSLVKSFAWWGGVLARAPLLCIQALQEQRTDIRPKNTLARPQQLTVETMRASHCSSGRGGRARLFRKVRAFTHLLFLHHQPCHLQPLEPFERNLPSQHLPQNLGAEQASGPPPAHP